MLRGAAACADFPTELETDSTDKVEQTWLLAGEALNIARPVVYTVTRYVVVARATRRPLCMLASPGCPRHLQRSRIFGGKSWIPVLASLGTDLASWQCSRRGTAMFGGSQPPETGPVGAWPCLPCGCDGVGRLCITCVCDLRVTCSWGSAVQGTDVARNTDRRMQPARRCGDVAAQGAHFAARCIALLLLTLYAWFRHSGCGGITCFGRRCSRSASRLAPTRSVHTRATLRSGSQLTHTFRAQQTTNIASYIPLFGVLVRYLRDVLLYFQRIYFYVAGSS